MNKLFILLSIFSLSFAHPFLPENQVITHRLKLGIQVGGKSLGDVEVGLFGEVVPKTAENFKALCTGELGNSNGVHMSYVGTKFHRIIPNFMIQGGDITSNNGKGGVSIYGKTFQDESFKVKHQPYCLSMANSGPDTNGSQFFITTTTTAWLDDKHVVFGRVLKGQEVVKLADSFGNPKGVPQKDVVISDCELLELE